MHTKNPNRNLLPYYLLFISLHLPTLTSTVKTLFFVLLCNRRSKHTYKTYTLHTLTPSSSTSKNAPKKKKIIKVKANPLMEVSLQVLEVVDEAFVEVIAQLEESETADDTMRRHSLVRVWLDDSVDDLYTSKNIFRQWDPIRILQQR